MSIIKFSPEELAAGLANSNPVAAPLGEPVSQVRSSSLASDDNPGLRTGVWECSPGSWRRQVKQAEFCHFLAGECTFTSDAGERIEIRAGDVLFFPENTGGIWDIRTASTKIFLVFNEAKPQ